MNKAISKINSISYNIKIIEIIKKEVVNFNSNVS